MKNLTEEVVRIKLPNEYQDIGIYIYDSIDSTNDEAKRLWKAERKAPAILVSRAQTAGRGRRGRSFYSPKDTGIYMSVLLQPETGLEDAVHITTATAVIVAKALQAFTGHKIGIKWVNDLYFEHKKICGILTEAIMEPNSAVPPAVVVGIGINISTKDFPKELQDSAGSLYAPDGAIDEGALIAQIVADLLSFTKNMGDCSYIEDYRQMSVVLGKEIRYNEGNVLVTARALDVDSEGGLMVELPDGSVKVLKSGEISVRIAE